MENKAIFGPYVSALVHMFLFNWLTNWKLMAHSHKLHLRAMRLRQIVTIWYFGKISNFLHRNSLPQNAAHVNCKE